MKLTQLHTIILLASLILVACAKDKNEPFDCAYDCKYFSQVDNISGRSNAKTLKGQILFSWKNNENGWNYAVVPNLNVSRADDRIGEANTISGEVCLKENLQYFAEGEEFYWRAEGTLETLDGKTIDLAVPPADIIQGLRNYCDEINVKLVF